MFEGTVICFEKFAVIPIATNNRVSFIAFSFSANSSATNYPEMFVFALVSETAISSTIVITLKHIFVVEHFCVL